MMYNNEVMKDLGWTDKDNYISYLGQVDQGLDEFFGAMAGIDTDSLADDETALMLHTTG